MENSNVRNIFNPLTDETESAWIDISVPIYSGMVQWPGDPAVHIDREKGDPHRASSGHTSRRTGGTPAESRGTGAVSHQELPSGAGRSIIKFISETVSNY